MFYSIEIEPLQMLNTTQRGAKQPQTNRALRCTSQTLHKTALQNLFKLVVPQPHNFTRHCAKSMTQHAVALKFHKTCRADVTYIVQRPTVT